MVCYRAGREHSPESGTKYIDDDGDVCAVCEHCGHTIFRSDDSWSWTHLDSDGNAAC